MHENFRDQRIAWRRTVPVVEKVSVEDKKTQANCWVCRKVIHLWKDCPNRRATTGYGCGAERHIRHNCLEWGQVSVAMVVRKLRIHSYGKVGRVNGSEVDVLSDTGSHHSLVKANVAVKCGLNTPPTERQYWEHHHFGSYDWRNDG